MCRAITPVSGFTAYWLSLTASDLTGPAPSDWSKATTTTPIAYSDISPTTLNCTVNKNSTERDYMFTPSGVPGTSGAAGDYHLILRQKTQDANIHLSFQLHRVNSSGVVQASSSTTAEQTSTNAEVLVFSLAGVDLGTWNTGDRLRFDVIVRNAATSGSAKTIALWLGQRTRDISFEDDLNMNESTEVTQNQVI